MESISKKILVSGPSISGLEVNYAADAACYGWDDHNSDYINLFEDEIKKYLGVKYALAVSSCTAALHLALLALDIGIDDEVIIPESTWVATVNPVSYVGAKPVFVDVTPDSWTIDPHKIVEAITPKTKAIIPVHLYGHPCNMEKIMEIAKKHNLFVIEDAAESFGGEYNGKKTGSIGNVGCFSFHGSKAIVMGEGGVLTTNNKEIYEKAKWWGDQGKHPTKRFYNTEIAYKYKLSNLQAALGYAQISRAEEIVQKKRTIFEWYLKRLKNIPDIRLNVELSSCRNTYWMVTIILGDSYTLNASTLSNTLLSQNIDTRPFFYPLSELPMYQCEVHSPVAHKLHERGLNLPCGYHISEAEVDYICSKIKNILNKQNHTSSQITGWLLYRENFLKMQHELKNQSKKTQLVNINFHTKSCECIGNIESLTKVEIQTLFDKFELENIYIRCFSDNTPTIDHLISMGFVEIVRYPQEIIENIEYDLIKKPFKKAAKYNITFQINKNDLK